MSFEHKPVLLEEALRYLRVESGGVIVDCTLGGGGHAEEVVRLLGRDGIFVGIDKDDAALNAAKTRLRDFAQQCRFLKGSFGELDRLLTEAGVLEVDGFLFDLGVSSHQFDRPERGFSYRFDAPLDMRMDLNQTLTAAKVVNEYSEADLARVIWGFGEEKWAKRIAKIISEARAKKPIETTFELVEIIKKAIPAPARRKGGHPAKRTFQALRIEVNQELNSLKLALNQSVKWLSSGGRVVVISYHSLEDRIVKKTFAELSKGCVCPPNIPICTCGQKPVLKVLTRKAVVPSPEELETNPRSSSAKLRAAEKVGD